MPKKLPPSKPWMGRNGWGEILRSIRRNLEKIAVALLAEVAAAVATKLDTIHHVVGRL
jgi:hypothetical protein